MSWLSEKLEGGIDFVGDAFGELTGTADIAEQQQQLGIANAAYIGQEAAEIERRKQQQFKQDLGMVEGAVASSGIIADTGTSKLFLEEMTKSFEAELAWDAKSVESRQDIAIRGGGIAGDVTRAGSTSQGVSTTISLLSMI